MSARIALLFASAALVAATTPARAQDATAFPPSAPVGRIEAEGGVFTGSWNGDWIDETTWQGEWRGTYAVGRDGEPLQDGRPVWRGPGGAMVPGAGPAPGFPQALAPAGQLGFGQPIAPRLGYTFAQREGWLADCRSLYLDQLYFTAEPARRGHDGGLIGGVLGALAGGIAGNRIWGGERVLGTVLGAASGGLAGIALGSLIGGRSDRRQERELALRETMLREEAIATRYCEAYLQRYEASASTTPFQGALQPQNFTLVRTGPAPQAGRECNCREIIREEWVEVPVASRSEPRPARRAAPAAKRVPIK